MTSIFLTLVSISVITLKVYHEIDICLCFIIYLFIVIFSGMPLVDRFKYNWLSS